MSDFYYILLLLVTAIGVKIWTSLDKYFAEKAANLATKQDIAEITTITEKVATDFHKILNEFDADLKFKYNFYESQYKELYSGLYLMICESESLRYILVNLMGECSKFIDIPIVEYEQESSEGEEQAAESSTIEEIIKCICTKHIYASPELIKLVSVIKLIKKSNMSQNAGDDKMVQIECSFKINIIKTILKDYYWLRGQLHLQTNSDEIEKLEKGEFFS